MDPKDLSIFIFCKTYLKGGAEKQALILARLFTENRFNVTLVNWSGRKIDPDNRAFIRKNFINYLGLEGNPLKKFISLLKVTRQCKKPVILAYLTLANFVAGMMRLLNRKLIVAGGIRTEKLPLLKLVFERFAHNHLNTITVFNNFSAQDKLLSRGFNPDKIAVIHNAIQVPVLVRQPRSTDSITIISVSRFVRSKDFHTALYAYKRLVESNPDKILRYRIVGYGYHEAAIRTMIKTLDLASSVELLIRPRNVYAILKESDIYLSTSIFEGLSNSIMEAMSAGLPVVATDVGDNKFLVENGVNGYLVKFKDTGAIVDKLMQLVNSEQTRKEFGDNSYNKILNGFSEENLFGKYLQLITNLDGSDPEYKR